MQSVAGKWVDGHPLVRDPSLRLLDFHGPDGGDPDHFLGVFFRPESDMFTFGKRYCEIHFASL